MFCLLQKTRVLPLQKNKGFAFTKKQGFCLYKKTMVSFCRSSQKNKMFFVSSIFFKQYNVCFSCVNIFFVLCAKQKRNTLTFWKVSTKKHANYIKEWKKWRLFKSLILKQYFEEKNIVLFKKSELILFSFHFFIYRLLFFHLKTFSSSQCFSLSKCVSFLFGTKNKKNVHTRKTNIVLFKKNLMTQKTFCFFGKNDKKKPLFFCKGKTLVFL